MADEQDSEPGEFIRFESKIQLGDGPDQRGDVRIEVQRLRDSEETNVRDVSIPLPECDAEHDTGTVGTTVHDATFGEFYYELMRGRDALREALGLPEEGNEDG